MNYLMILFIISQNSPSNAGGFLGYQMMYLTPNFAPLNDSFYSAGQSSINFEGGVYTQGVAGYAVSGALLLGGFGYKGSIINETSSLRVKADFSGGFFETGLALFKSGLLNIYPLIGIGSSNFKLNFRPLQTDETFRDVLISPARLSAIKTGGLSIEPAVIFQLWIKNKSSQSISFLIKVSYFYLPGKADWKFEDGGEVLKGPDFRPGGIVISSGIFFGGSG